MRERGADKQPTGNGKTVYMSAKTSTDLMLLLFVVVRLQEEQN